MSDRHVEDLLRDRLHEADSIKPPDPDFEFRALRAGQERLKRRRSWTRGLVGAAAAVVVGALAIPALGRLQVGEGTSAGGSAAGSALSAPEAATGGSGADASGPNLARAGTPPDGMSLENVPDDLRQTFAQVRGVLAAPPYDDVFSSLTYDPSVPPNGRVVLHLTRPDTRAINVARTAFAGRDVAVETSAYSLASCNQTWAALAADPQLRPDTVTITVLGCDANGRVAVRVTPNAPPASVARLAEYGDTLSLAAG